MFLPFRLAAALQLVIVLGGSNPCRKYEGELNYKCDKDACLDCPAGKGVVQQCNGSTPTVCEHCVAGVNFSESSNPYDGCEPIDQCSEGRVVDIPATPQHDVTCRCKDAYTENSAGECTPIDNPKTSSIVDHVATTIFSTSLGTHSVFPATLTPLASISAGESAAASQTSTVYAAGPPFGGTVSAFRTTPVPSVTQSPQTGRPTSDSMSPLLHSREKKTTAIYVVIGVCASVALVTAIVVGVACWHSHCLKGTGCYRKKNDDEVILTGIQNRPRDTSDPAGSDDPRMIEEISSGQDTMICHASRNFLTVGDLTERIVERLATTLLARPDKYPGSLLSIAQSVRVDVDKVNGHVATRSNPARFILDELRDISPTYSLSSLCRVFVENDRPECARKLIEYVREEGGNLSLPDRLLALLYPRDTSDDECVYSSLSSGSIVNEESNSTGSASSFTAVGISTEDSEQRDIIPPSPPPTRELPSNGCPEPRVQENPPAVHVVWLTPSSS